MARWAGRPFRRSLAFLALLVALLPLSGCVQRRLTIRSNPPGARVYIDDYEIGTTPCSTDYVYYGTRKIRLVRDGYETLTVEQRIAPPWYELFPLEFVSENLWPGEIRDEREFEFVLKPQRLVPTTELVGRAEELRRANQTGAPISPLDPTRGSGPAVVPRTRPGYLEPGFVPRELVLPPPAAGGTLPAPVPGSPLPPGGALPPAGSGGIPIPPSGPPGAAPPSGVDPYLPPAGAGGDPFLTAPMGQGSIPPGPGYVPPGPAASRFRTRSAARGLGAPAVSRPQ